MNNIRNVHVSVSLALAFSAIIAVAILTSHNAFAHGIPIAVSVQAGRLKTSAASYLAELQGLAADTPGIGIASPEDGVDAGTILTVIRSGPLWYWNPETKNVETTKAGATLTLGTGASILRITGDLSAPLGESASFPPYTGLIGWHDDIGHSLTANASPGMYGAPLQIGSEGAPYQESAPFLMAWMNAWEGATHEDEHEAQDALLLRAYAWRTRRPGDADLNGTVNLSDFNILKKNFGQSGTTWFDGDFNQDAAVNLQDFNLLKANFGGSTIPAPEPSGWGLALGVFVVFAVRRFVSDPNR